jgi:hypothetical protein
MRYEVKCDVYEQRDWASMLAVLVGHSTPPLRITALK